MLPLLRKLGLSKGKKERTSNADGADSKHDAEKAPIGAASPEEKAAIYARLGLNKSVAESTSKSPKIAAALDEIIEDSGVLSLENVQPKVGLLLYDAATLLPPKTTRGSKARAAVIQLIVSGEICARNQVEAAANFLKSAEPEFDIASLKAACGVGVKVSEAEIDAAISQLLEEYRAAGKFSEARSQGVLRGKLFGELNKRLPWADGRIKGEKLNAAMEKALASVVADTSAGAGQKPKQAKVEEAPAAPVPVTEEKDEFVLAGRDLEWAHNSPEALARHRKRTGGKILTRFPPEPNGYLHLGHAKAMKFNFGVAAERGGATYLRFDDTNPEAEKQEYIDSIIDCCLWLGHRPFKITYSSDYFDELYALAVELIRRDCAFVCHLSDAEIKAYRQKGEPSPYRNRSVQENLDLFENMRRGKYREGECCLRMKGDLSNPNPTMWDQVFYRILYTPHPRTGSKWCIYPTYDFTHCIVDSLEDITYSLCTLEFEVRRESYYWLLHVLDLYKPHVWEYSRLNITYNVMSKRKLQKLVHGGYVNGWDDPRLITLSGLRRRGYTPEAINAFCASAGVSRTENMQQIEKLEAFLRDDLNVRAPRGICVMEPLKVKLLNLPGDEVTTITAPVNPLDESKGVRPVFFSREIYIDRDDFRPALEKGFYRLCPGQEVRLKYVGHIIRLEKIITDPKTNEVVELHCSIDKDAPADKKVKSTIHWLSAGHPSRPETRPLSVELRLYDRLFLSENPAEADNWLDLINPRSLVVAHNALCEPGLCNARVFDKFQFERHGFFCVDPDTENVGHLVFNLTSSLRETKKRKDPPPKE